MEFKNKNNKIAPENIFDVWKIISISALLLSVVSLSFMFTQFSGANADYICTHVVTEDRPCGNGSWGDWETISTSGSLEDCNLEIVQKRVYTGTRETQHIFEYLNRRTSCEEGWTQEQSGSSSGESGFHGGRVITEIAICQIEEIRTLRGEAAGNPKSCVGGSDNPDDSQDPDITIETFERDLERNTQTQDVSSMDELDELRNSLSGCWITAVPSMVRKNSMSLIKWGTIDMDSCIVKGTNGDDWSGVSGSELSSPVNTKTVFDLECVGSDDNNYEDSVEVNVIPSYEEF